MRTCTHVHTHACLHHTRNESNEKQMFHHPRVFFMAHISSCFVILKTLSGKRQLACDKKRNCWETELASIFLRARTAAKHRWVARRWHSCVPAQFLTPRVAVSWGLRVSGHKRPVESGGRRLSLMLRDQLLGWSGHPEFLQQLWAQLPATCRPTVYKFLHARDAAGGTQPSEAPPTQCGHIFYGGRCLAWLDAQPGPGKC